MLVSRKNISFTFRRNNLTTFFGRGNTEGWRCERCKDGYWGDPHDGCELCNCYEIGAISNVCDVTNGQCVCKPRFGGHQCDECEVNVQMKLIPFLRILIETSFSSDMEILR